VLELVNVAVDNVLVNVAVTVDKDETVAVVADVTEDVQVVNGGGAGAHKAEPGNPGTQTNPKGHGWILQDGQETTPKVPEEGGAQNVPEPARAQKATSSKAASH